MLRVNYLILLTALALATQSTAQNSPNFYANPLLVNGIPLNYETFSLYSRGSLALVEGDPGTSAYKPVQFRVMLRRAGILIRQWPASVTASITSVQLEELWPFARFGDELIVEPTGKLTEPQPNSRGKRVIKLKATNWLTVNWIKRDGC